MIDRDDRTSQLRTFKQAMKWLKLGVPVMAFPEGTRSIDGRLMDFKGGIFSLAVKCKVPIVPITLTNTHQVFPPNALVPVKPGLGLLSLHVHSAIDTDGLSEEDLAEKVKKAFLSQLPLHQHPLNAGDHPVNNMLTQTHIQK